MLKTYMCEHEHKILTHLWHSPTGILKYILNADPCLNMCRLFWTWRAVQTELDIRMCFVYTISYIILFEIPQSLPMYDTCHKYIP